MRALYLEGLKLTNNTQEIPLESSQMQHLKKVARVKEGDSLLILNGEGDKYYGYLKEYLKKNILFELERAVETQRGYNITLAILMPKKDAFEEILQKAAQLGIEAVYTFSSKYSQFNLEMLNDRQKNILHSAYQQANNPFKIIIHPTRPFDDISSLAEKFDHKVYFSSQSDRMESLASLGINSKILYLVGPEGGLSPDEEKKLEEFNFKFAHLPTPILRSPTAVTAGVSFLISRL